MGGDSLKVAALARQVPGSDAASSTCVAFTSILWLTSRHTKMSIHYSGTLMRSGGLMSAIIKQLKRVSLKPVSKIDVHFDPFDTRSKNTRDFLYYISAPKIRATNPLCPLKTEVACDRSEPTITFSLQSGEKLVLKTTLLTSLEILELYNKHITSLIPPNPEEVEAKKALQEERRKKKSRPHHRIKLWSKRRHVLL